MTVVKSFLYDARFVYTVAVATRHSKQLTGACDVITTREFPGKPSQTADRGFPPKHLQARPSHLEQYTLKQYALKDLNCIGLSYTIGKLATCTVDCKFKIRSQNRPAKTQEV